AWDPRLPPAGASGGQGGGSAAQAPRLGAKYPEVGHTPPLVPQVEHGAQEGDQQRQDHARLQEQPDDPLDPLVAAQGRRRVSHDRNSPRGRDTSSRRRPRSAPSRTPRQPPPPARHPPPPP